MSNTSFEIQSGSKNSGKFVMIRPSQASFSDIPELNRARESWDLAKVEDLGKSIRQRGIVTPLVGYVENKSIKILRGRQRMGIGQALEAEGFKLNGSMILLPVTLVPKPTTPEQVREYLLDTLADNTWRYEDDYSTRVQSFTVLREMGLSLEEIGEQTGFSHTLVDQHLKVSSVKVLNTAAIKGHPVKQLAAFTTKAFQVKDKNGKAKGFDETKIKAALEESIAEANKAGKAKLTEGVVSSKRGGSESKKSASLGLRWLKTILDQPAGDVPPGFILFIRIYLGQINSAEGLKKAKGALEWLEGIDFEPKKKAARKAAKAKASKANDPTVDEDEDEDEDDFEG